nr:PREDICTED: RIMS-binding protein 3B-like [Latimeria chalumnae]|eukprot:XP_014341737.1 PREDICTED: RIMS-binding protein 3B-like [Latimeria chalumnae]
MTKDNCNTLPFSPKTLVNAVLEEYKCEIEKLKADLESEKLKRRQDREKFTAEVKWIKESSEKERQKIVDDLASRYERQGARELQQLKEHLQKEREAEIRQLLRWKEAEFRELQLHLGKERDAVVRQARQLQRQLAEELVSKGLACKGAGENCLNSPGCAASSHCYHKLQEVLGKLRWETDGEQAAVIRRLKIELDLERSLFLRYILEGHNWTSVVIKKGLRPSSSGSPEVAVSRKGSPVTILGAAVPSSSNGYPGTLTEFESFCPGSQGRGPRLHHSSPGSVVPTRESLNISPEAECHWCYSSPASLLESQGESSGTVDIPWDYSQSISGEMFTSGSHTPGPGQHGFFAFESTNGTDYESLVRQNSELLRALGELERKCATLREENNLLRKSSSPETEEKVKRLKRKNAELAVIAKRLEERARKLQEANLKVVNTPAPLRGSTLEQCKKAFARQRAKDLEEHADALLAKDKEIAALQQECRELHAKIGPGKNYSDRWNLTDFEHLLRESQKEVLRLQRQLAAVASRQPSNKNNQKKQKTEGSVPRAVDEQRNSSEGRKLIQIPECIVSDQESQQQIQQLETELNKKRKEYENLEQEVRKRQKRCQELETDLQDVQSKNIRLVEDNVRLNQKTLQLEKVELENADLKVWLREVTQERDWALEENQRLKAKLENLEQVLKLQQASSKDTCLLQLIFCLAILYAVLLVEGVQLMRWLCSVTIYLLNTNMIIATNRTFEKD